MKKIILSCIALIIFTAAISHCGVGTTGSQFLKILPSARGSALGGAFSAVSKDVYSIYWNPAGLVGIDSPKVSFTYLNYFSSVDYGFIGYADGSDNYSFGGALTYLNVGKIPAREEDTVEPDRYFNAQDTALILSGAKKDAVPNVLEDLSLGANLKLISGEIDQNSGFTLAFDIGGLYQVIPDYLCVSLVLQNISWGIKYEHEYDMLPLNLKAGFAYRPPDLDITFLGEIDEYIIDEKFYLSTGIEYFPVKQLFLRGGYRLGYDTASLGSEVGLAGGVGVNVWNISLDYAFLPFGDLGDTHRVTLSADF